MLFRNLISLLCSAMFITPYASAQPDSYEPIFHITGEYENSHLGNLIANCGDQNGDGADELLLSDYDPNVVYMFNGGESMDTIPDLIFYEEGGLASDICYSENIISLEYGSLLITYYSSGWNSILLYNCGNELDTTSDMTFQGEEYNDGFGSRLCTGDYNGDGWNDMIASAVNFGPWEEDWGKLYVYYGGPDMDNIADFTITAMYNDFGDSFGSGLACGDVNGDGFDDILATCSSPRKAYLFYGSAEPDSIPDWSYEQWPEYLNTQAAIIPNLNGDQFADMILHDITGNTMIFFGDSQPASQPDQAFTLGFPSRAGDLNGDTLDDFIGLTMTSIKIYHGSLSGAVYSSSIITSAPPYILGYCGDVNGDNVDDIAYSSFEPFYYGQTEIYADTTLTAVNGEQLTVNRTFELLPAYPNPFNALTTIPFRLDRTGKVELKIYDVLGREVQSLVTGHSSLGKHEAVWNAEGVSSGVYLVRLDLLQSAGTLQHTQVRKVLLVK